MKELRLCKGCHTMKYMESQTTRCRQCFEDNICVNCGKSKPKNSSRYCKKCFTFLVDKKTRTLEYERNK